MDELTNGLIHWKIIPISFDLEIPETYTLRRPDVYQIQLQRKQCLTALKYVWRPLHDASQFGSDS